jgi:hypothetical protein
VNSDLALGETSDAGQDFVRRFRPNKRLGIFVVRADVFANGGFQFFRTSEYAASNSLVGNFGEPTLHQVDPRRVGGRKVQMESRPFSEPCPDERRLVGTVVIHDDVRLQSGGHVGLDQIQELAKLGGAMAPVQWCSWPITRLVFNSSAANRDVVPWRW